MLWAGLPYRDEPECIDDPSAAFGDIRASMRDLATTNSLFGGTAAIVHGVAALLSGASIGTAVTVLDIATGSADIPVALMRWGSRRGLRIRISGLDNQAQMLETARDAMADASGRNDFPSFDGRLRRDLTLVQADATHLPFATGTFDIATCSLAFHHLGSARSVSVLREMDRVTCRGFVVSDLRRDRTTLALVRTGIALIGGHAFTRHDSLASVRRAFTPLEWQELAGLSGVRDLKTGAFAYFRLTMTQNKQTNGQTER